MVVAVDRERVAVEGRVGGRVVHEVDRAGRRGRDVGACDVRDHDVLDALDPGRGRDEAAVVGGGRAGVHVHVVGEAGERTEVPRARSPEGRPVVHDLVLEVDHPRAVHGLQGVEDGRLGREVDLRRAAVVARGADVGAADEEGARRGDEERRHREERHHEDHAPFSSLRPAWHVRVLLETRSS